MECGDESTGWEWDGWSADGSVVFCVDGGDDGAGVGGILVAEGGCVVFGAA